MANNRNETAPNKPGLPDSPERGIGNEVGPVPAPSPAPVVDPVGAGPAKKWYRVIGPGSVRLNSVDYRAGAEIQLGAAEALTIDDHLEEFVPAT